MKKDFESFRPLSGYLISKSITNKHNLKIHGGIVSVPSRGFLFPNEL